MLPKDRILQALHAKNTTRSERSPVPAALLSGGTWAFRQKGLTLLEILEKPELGAPVIVEVNQWIQSAIVWPGSGYHNLLVHILGGEIKFRPQGNIDVVQPALVKAAAADRLDLGKIDQHEWVRAIRLIIRQVQLQTGHRVMVGTSGWGPFTLAGQFYGVEKLMRGMYKDKQAIHALMAVMTEVCLAYLVPAIAAGAEIISVAEPTASGDLVSRRHFEEFVAPYIGQVAQQLQQHGAFATLHICGNIKDRLELVPAMHIDLLSLDYKVDLGLAQQVLQGRVAVAGNVNPVLLKDAAPAAIIQAAEQCIRQAGQAANYILMPGCDIPPGVPLNNVQAFLQAGREFV